MPRKIFGTDGIRGQANIDPMTPGTIMALAMATGAELTRGDHHHVVVIGKDTRLSGYMVEPALTAGFVSMGMDVVLVGPLPTPAIAMLTRSLRADLGVMISASHNPYQDYGIKFFGADGYKLSDDLERSIETRFTNNTLQLALPDRLGKARRLDDAAGRYIEFIKNTFPRSLRLDGLRIVVDCAHGAAYKIAPVILWELGAEIIPLGITPNGCNINLECGATHPEVLQQAVKDHRADLGIALDGDADRVTVVDEKGEILDGDQIIALIATHWQERGLLKGRAVVATEMSNLGLELYLKEHNITLFRTAVGDRYVIEKMRQLGCNVGGEPSGHILLTDFATTGDGLLAALQVLAVKVAMNLPLSKVAHVFKPIPQQIKNIPVINKEEIIKSSLLQQSLDQANHLLGEQGRVIVRKSGTEPVIRIMVESADSKLLQEAMTGLVYAINQCIPKMNENVEL